MGISHIEDLAIDEFVNAIKNIGNFQATEKLDGAQVLLGLDEQGKFFTSREKKGGQRYYSPDDYDTAFWSTGFKSAHQALQNKEHLLKKVLNSGDIIEAEILYGPQPNAIPYSSDTNFIVFLRPIEGSPDIELLRKTLGDIKVSIEVKDVPTTSDGKNIDSRIEEQVWQFVKVPDVDSKHIATLEKNSNIDKKVKDLETFLRTQNTVVPQLNNLELISVKLNKKPEQLKDENWGEIKTIIADERAKLLDQLYLIKISIKEDLLIQLVRKVSSQLGPKLEDGGWIEGVVFRHPETEKQFKVVDKDIFTAINKFNFQIRNDIKDNIWLRFKKESSIILGYPELYGPRKTQFLATNKKEELGKNLDIKKIKSKMNILINDCLFELLQKLKDYEKQRPSLVVHINNKIRKYEGEIHTRTLQEFASIRKRLEQFKQEYTKAKKPEDFIKIYLEEQMVTEGGNMFPNSKDISIIEIPKTLAYISKVSNIPLETIRNNLLGSVGKASRSGDIDIAVDSNTISMDDLFNKLKAKLGQNAVGMSKGLNIVHAEIPIEGNKEYGTVQTDFMFSNVPTWTKFNFFSSGDSSKYKGVLRTKLLMATLVAANKTNYENGELVRRQGWVWVPSKGIEFQIRERPIDKNGNRLKGWKIVYHGEVENDPATVAKILFPEIRDIVPEQLNSVENIMQLIAQSKTPKEQKLIMDIFRNSSAQQKIDVPKELQ